MAELEQANSKWYDWVIKRYKIPQNRSHELREQPRSLQGVARKKGKLFTTLVLFYSNSSSTRALQNYEVIHAAGNLLINNKNIDFTRFCLRTQQPLELEIEGTHLCVGNVTENDFSAVTYVGRRS